MLIALTFGGAFMVNGVLLAQCGDCSTNRDVVVSGFIGYRIGTGDETDMTVPPVIADELRPASGEWTGAFQVAGSNIEIGETPNGPFVVVMNFAICSGGWAQVSRQYNRIYFCPDILFQPSPDFIRRVVRHEFGHVAGFGATNCPKSDSVMADIQPGDMQGAAVNVGCADTRSVAQYYYSPPSQPDNDGDGVPADQDCNDDDPHVAFNCEEYYCRIQDGHWNGELCVWQEPGTPILIDVDGDGFSLTDVDGGVAFDLNANGIADRLPWTAPGVDDAWLSLDRNGNGLIDDGLELFGNFSEQPPTATPNGFVALALYDSPSAGGNADGWLGPEDTVYQHLRLWRDANHDGISQQNELQPLADAGLIRISLAYRESYRVDRFGNWFRYRAEVVSDRPSGIARWAYDVFLMGKPDRSRVR